MALRRHDGFTLIELLTVLVILAVLITIGIASYIGFRQRAADGAAKQTLRATLPAVHAFATDGDGGFTGMTVAALRTYDQAISGITVVAAEDDSYCLSATVNDREWYASGPPFSLSLSSCA